MKAFVKNILPYIIFACVMIIKEIYFPAFGTIFNTAGIIAVVSAYISKFFGAIIF
jgi:hypothetical protein